MMAGSVAVRIDLSSDLCAIAKRRTLELRGWLPVPVILFPLLLQVTIEVLPLALAPVPERWGGPCCGRSRGCAWILFFRGGRQRDLDDTRRRCRISQNRQA